MAHDPRHVTPEVIVAVIRGARRMSEAGGIPLSEAIDKITHDMALIAAEAMAKATKATFGIDQ